MSKAGGSTMTPRIHHPAGIPDVLHLGEQSQSVCSVHAAKQFRARPPVAVLAGDRAAQCHNEIRRLLDERSECRQAACTEQIEVDPHVHAALTEVAVMTLRTIRADRADRRGRAGSHRDARVEPPHPPSRPRPRRRRPCGLRGPPRPCGIATARLRLRIGDQRRGRRRAGVAQLLEHLRRGQARGRGIVAAHLHQEPGPSGGKPRLDRGGPDLGGQPLDQVDVDRLDRQRIVPQQHRHAVGRRDGMSKPSTHSTFAAGRAVSATVACRVAAKPPSLPHSNPATL